MLGGSWMSDEAAQRMGLEFLAAGLVEFGPDNKPRPTLKGILYINFILSLFTMIDLFEILSEKVNEGVGAVQTDDAMTKILREFATAMQGKGKGDGEGKQA